MTSVRVFKPDLSFIEETENYQSLQFERSHFGVGQFEIHINMHLQGAESFEKGNLIVVDKQPHKAGIIQTKEVALDENGKTSENFKLTGYTLDGLINRRVTVPPFHTSHDRRTGSAETVMKHYVMDHFVNPVDKKRIMPFLEVAPNKERGPRVSWESRYKNIAEELETIGNLADIGWIVYFDFIKKKLIFDVVEGRDLTQENSKGNHPVFFSPDFSTVKSQSFLNSDVDLRTVGYVGGQGEGVQRKIIQLGETSGWDRMEAFIDARDIGTEDEETDEELTEEEIEQQLIERGIRKMQDMQTVLSFETEILTPITRKHNQRQGDVVQQKMVQETPFEYEKDFDLGDYVDVYNKHWGVSMKAPIVNFKEIYENEGFKLEAVFGEVAPTLIDKIKKQFNELQGIETQELPSKIEINTKKYAEGYSNHLDEIIRDNLNLNAPLPDDVTLSNEGITGGSSSESYARVSHRGLDIEGGAIRIKRPDGAVWMEDGMVNSTYAIGEYSPPYMEMYEYQFDSGGSEEWPMFDQQNQFWACIANRITGASLLDGRYVDKRDPSKNYTVRFQRYEFSHDTRYLVLGYRPAINTNNPRHQIVLYDADSDEMIFQLWIPRGGSSVQNLAIDLGTPTFERKAVEVRIGIYRSDNQSDNDLLRFRINRKYLTDHV